MLGEIWRGVTTLGIAFGALPWVCRRAARVHRGGGRALDVLSEHMTRVRRLAGIDVTVDGHEHLPAKSGYVMTANQQSIADDLGIFAALAPLLDLRLLAAEYAVIPFVREGIELSGGVLLQRGNRAHADDVLARLTDAARRGQRVGIWPEGKLSPDGAVGRFKRGAFLVAIRAGVPVVPVAVDGGRDILRPGSLRMRPGVLRFRIGPPIDTAQYREDDALALAERVQGVVTSLHAQLRAG